MKKITEMPKDWRPGLDVCNAAGDFDPATLGWDYALRTTSFLRTSLVEQKFYTVAPADFMTVEVGEGAWLEEIVQNRQVIAAGDFETGLINVAAQQAESPEIQLGISPKKYPIATWAFGYQYSLPELKKAVATNNWDIPNSCTKALKTIWDLGIQKMAFLGSRAQSSANPFYGLLTLPDPTVDTTTLTTAIKDMDVNEFMAFAEAILGVFFKNTNYTVLPDRMVIPTDDYLGLGGAVSPTFPIADGSKIIYLERTLKQLSGNADFKIIPLAYAMAANNAGYVSTNGTNRTVLYKNDPDVVRIGIPANFATTNPSTNDNFYFKGKGFGQFTGVQNYREREIMYFDR